MKSGTGLDNFARLHTQNFFDVGIAEGHAVTMAGGLAKQGMIPFCAVYSTFIQRAYDMIFHDVCLQNLHVIFAIDRAGLVSDDGQTHQGIFDVGIFLQMPNITVFCPSGISEMEQMIKYTAYELKGPVAIRYPRGCNDRYVSKDPPYLPMLLDDAIDGSKNADAVIISYGRMVENAADAAVLLKKRDITAKVIKLTNISGIPYDYLIELIGDVNSVFIVEECVSGGCVASKIALEFSERNLKHKIVAINLGYSIIPSASVEELTKMFSLDAQGIAHKIHSSSVETSLPI